MQKSSQRAPHFGAFRVFFEKKCAKIDFFCQKILSIQKKAVPLRRFLREVPSYNG